MNTDKIPSSKREHAPLEKGLDKLLSPFGVFFRSQASTGVLLLLAALLAMVMANSDYQRFYESIGHLPLSVGLGDWQVKYSLHHWVNDGLMVIFFFILGLEIKRELLAGYLRQVRQSLLVLFMAAGGMVLPALIYALCLRQDAVALMGWGIPMATDTAFALGALALLGARAPRSAAVMLSALAIVDDIGAVLVISVFYTEDISWLYLARAAGVVGLLCLFNLLGMRRPIFYAVGGLVLWWCVHQSGVHATTAGILAAITVPARPYAETGWFTRRMTMLLRRFQQLDHPDKSILEEHRQHDLLEEVHQVAEQTTTPLQHWGSVLDRPVSYAIVPLFAFLNAGVSLPNTLSAETLSPVTWVTMLSLVVGKTLGIASFTWVALKFGWGALPKDMRFLQVVALGLLAGMGFTMSLFIGNLAFLEHPQVLVEAKLGILAGSLLAGLLGSGLFLLAHRQAD
ncbi:Na+/H+ antiporter NhaA [Aestuariicella hydrocarbonica]|uniref:Na(+)/H(+) antiporter NhaA n=1 Tax=Pseudomaricurvus hydrocarbonicus TaxID=1470433 RepID=A0A9E5T433_9GAMM|nr:Na+/H+ antiporter NhaA [Aestuariicella hydrocarbonica]NHO67637.1 Na+/H+ antiporter NhaA [Aestuariicella hydrocarbonica]